MSELSINPTDIGTIYCIGRNYVMHAKELNNPIPATPVIFTKARASVCQFNENITLPLALGRCDHETEIAVRIGHELYKPDRAQALAAISHLGLALDLTLREKQTELKQQQYPWDLAKSFVNACPISPLQSFDDQYSLADIQFSLTVNGKLRQSGNSSEMLFDIITLIQFISNRIKLLPGDLILTGTPAGVAPLNNGDSVTLSFNHQIIAQADIVRA